MYLIPSARGLFIALLVWKGFVHFPKIKLFYIKNKQASPLLRKSLFKCAINILLLNNKIGKNTFSLLFMYFSEIYLKWHLSILDLYLVKM